MLYKVEARTPRGDLLTLQLDDISNGYIVADIDGLGPVKATVITSKFAQDSGVAYQGSTIPERNITMTLEYDLFSDTSVWELRNGLYPFFMSEQKVSLRFYMESGLTVDIDGVSESMDSPLFVQEPKADISIVCPKPDFIDMTPVVKSGFSTSDTVATDVVYDGTSDTGMTIVVNVNHTLSELTIYQTTPSGDFKSLDFSAPLVAGDVLTINTMKGNKSATLTRSGVDSSIMYGVSQQSTWLQLEHGTNAIRVYATDGGSPASITFLNKYGGL